MSQITRSDPPAGGMNLWAVIVTGLVCLMAGIVIGSTVMAPRPAPITGVSDLPPDHPPLGGVPASAAATPLDAPETSASDRTAGGSAADRNFDSPAVRANIAQAASAADLVRIANQQYDQGHAKLAAAAYERAIARGARSPDLLTDLGTMYRALHRNDDAIRVYRQAVALDPTHANSRFNLGTALFEKGDMAGGTRAWQEYLRLAPNGPKAGVVRQHLSEMAQPGVPR